MSSSAVNSTSSSNNDSSTSASPTNRLANMDMADFLKLLITELQSQDPMNPMDNAQMVEQISQIRAIESNTRLTETLKSVALGQSISTASSLIGRHIKGLNTDATRIEGTVDRVTVTDGVTELHIGDDIVTLTNVSEILPSDSQS